MRRLLFVLALVLAACGGNGDGVEATSEPVQHVPDISNLKLSPNSALYMEGGGSVQVTAEFSFTDLGQDIETLHVRMSDGTSLATPIDDLVGTVSGTLAKAFAVSTAGANACMVEIWVIDKAGQSSNHLSAAFSVIQHAPEISSVTLSPDSALYMEGDGNVVVTAEIGFMDTALDIQGLWVRMPDGTTISFNESFNIEAGTFLEDLNVSTEKIGAFTIEFWLVDTAGNSSQHRTEQFTVVGNTQSSDWTSRLSGLPYALNDVIWDGSVFIAIGNGGTILTSADGIDWVTRESGTDANLNSVAAYGSDIFAVGDEVVLLSTDHGENWSTKDKFIAVNLTAVVVTASQVVVSGFSYGLVAGITTTSEDRGDTWQFADFWYAADLTYRNRLFVGVTFNWLSTLYRAAVIVSSDGESWNEIVLRDGQPALFTVTHDGNQFFVAGADGAAFASFDGFNWTQLQTPVTGVSYLSAAWNGSKLVLAGGSDSPSERPIGIASTDGGVSWEIFNIDGTYESRGMAFGNGRFVSVGQTAPVSGEGAIYTAD